MERTRVERGERRGAERRGERGRGGEKNRGERRRVESGECRRCAEVKKIGEESGEAARNSPIYFNYINQLTFAGPIY